MAKKLPSISDAEWPLMQLLWASAPRTAADLTDELAEEFGWASSTVKTLLGRLVQKGAVYAEPDGKRYLYRPAVTRHRCVRAESRSFIDRVFGGDAGLTAAHLIKNHRLSAEQLDELRQLLDERSE